ncbi:hypothetical protein DE146DRAFT_774342, partial [Phaeosphaeria sp. MPI-PUGE-AT-0046c]
LLLEADPRLAEVPGLSRESLDALARSVELRRQQLDRDIRDYISRRQHDLRAYEQEVGARPQSISSPRQKAKRTKHTRVQKREKELYGLVTPVFLPLLDARDTSPKQEQKRPPPTPKPKPELDLEAPGRAEHATPTGEHASDPGRDMHGETSKKPKRSSTSTSSSAPTKKSALRQHSSTKPRRKRVSLVIDGHTVLPADSVAEPALLSPSSEATSASNSTASLDDMLVDPRLTRPAEPHIHTERTDAVHHSLPLPMSNIVHSPTKPLVDNTPSSLTIDPELEIPDPTPSDAAQDAADAQTFNTYVGGLRGSGADDVDQAGSYGYPSSLGASYLESYMQSRPLRVRMEAADRAGLEGAERKGMVEGKGADEEEEDEDDERERERGRRTREEEEEEGDFMGEMEGF